MEDADLYRFFVPGMMGALAGGRAVELPEEEAHHARDALRMEAGTDVVVFDGDGHWGRAVIEAVTRKKVTVILRGEPVHEREPAVQLTLATAIPKGDRAQWLIEQASQLNVARLAWLSTKRGVVKWDAGRGTMDKWRRWAVEAAKQCGRARVMRIAEPAGLAEVLAAAAEGAGARVLWLDPGAGGKGAAELRSGGNGEKLVALIGPEGGWSAEERELLERAVERGEIVRVRLMETVLRVETACAAIAAILLCD